MTTLVRSNDDATATDVPDDTNKVYVCDLLPGEEGQGSFAATFEVAFEDELPVRLVARGPGGECFHLVPTAIFPGAGNQSAINLIMAASLLPSSPDKPPVTGATPFIGFGPMNALLVIFVDVLEWKIPLANCALPGAVRGYVLDSFMRAIA